MPSRGRLLHVSLRVLLWGAHWSHLLFFSSSHFASDAESRAPRHIPPILFLPLKPRDSETMFSKSLGRNRSSDVPITPSSWESRLPPPIPQLIPKSRLLFYPGKLLTWHAINSPGDTHCSGFHIHPAASHANNPRSRKQFPSMIAPVPSRPTQP